MKSKYPNTNAQTEGVAHVHSLYGESAMKHVAHPEMVGQMEGTIKLQGQSQFSSYKAPPNPLLSNPARRSEDGGELCGTEGCGAFPSKKFHPYCAGHARSLGIASWESGRKPKAVADDNTG